MAWGVAYIGGGEANTVAAPLMVSEDTGRGGEVVSEGAWLQVLVYGALKSVTFGA